ncbi:MAG: 2-isopropylmalate synthase, partial [Planctomycetaceae bacterium]|nr:2-isopropylmalate synthase [Planctomycetaceae bacterium]
EIYDADIVALIDNRTHQAPQQWKIVAFHTFGGTGTIPTATIDMQHEDGRRVQDAATGDGPVDAAFKCLERIVGVNARLQEYTVRSVSKGKDALGEVTVQIDVDEKTFHGKGVSTDIIEASALAYLQALNKSLTSDRGRSQHAQHGM